MQTFPLGSNVRFSGAFTDLIAGAAADPTTVTCKVKNPAGTEASYTAVTKDAVGQYHYDLTLTTPGAWVVRWVGAGAIIASDEMNVYAQPSKFAAP